MSTSEDSQCQVSKENLVGDSMRGCKVYDGSELLYGERDILDQGQYYVNHVNAMTAEALHSKSDIAAELAHRDLIIADLQQFHDWAEPQIIHRGEDQLKIEQLTQQLSLARDANGMIETRCKELESNAKLYRDLRARLILTRLPSEFSADLEHPGSLEICVPMTEPEFDRRVAALSQLKDATK